MLMRQTSPQFFRQEAGRQQYAQTAFDKYDHNRRAESRMAKGSLSEVRQ